MQVGLSVVLGGCRNFNRQHLRKAVVSRENTEAVFQHVKVCRNHQRSVPRARAETG